MSRDACHLTHAHLLLLYSVRLTISFLVEIGHSSIKCISLINKNDENDNPKTMLSDESENICGTFILFRIFLISFSWSEKSKKWYILNTLWLQLAVQCACFVYIHWWPDDTREQQQQSCLSSVLMIFWYFKRN